MLICGGVPTGVLIFLGIGGFVMVFVFVTLGAFSRPWQIVQPPPMPKPPPPPTDEAMIEASLRQRRIVREIERRWAAESQ